MRDSRAEANGGVGIRGGGKVMILRDSVRNNISQGIVAGDGSVVRESTAASNKSHGIEATAKCLIQGNTLRDTGASGTGDGLRLTGTGTGNQIRQNTASNHPGGANYNVPAGNDLAPEGGAATATSPWADLEF